eukprot:g36193.t1
MVTREFVTHVFASAAVRAFLKWSEDTYSPDEHVWATLLRMRDTPGYVQYTRGAARTLGRAVKWSSEAGDVAKGAPYSHCTGMYRHMICVYGAGDLQWLLNQRPFFANKFDPDVDNMAVQCMEEYLRNRTLGETGAGVQVGAGVAACSSGEVKEGPLLLKFLISNKPVGLQPGVLATPVQHQHLHIMTRQCNSRH